MGDRQGISSYDIGLLRTFLGGEATAAVGARQPAPFAFSLAREAVDMVVLQMTASVSNALIHAATMPEVTARTTRLSRVESSLRPTVRIASDLSEARQPAAAPITGAGPPSARNQYTDEMPKSESGKLGRKSRRGFWAPAFLKP